jgi:hypothetical protein
MPYNPAHDEPPEDAMSLQEACGKALEIMRRAEQSRIAAAEHEANPGTQPFIGASACCDVDWDCEPWGDVDGT